MHNRKTRRQSCFTSLPSVLIGILLSGALLTACSSTPPAKTEAAPTAEAAKPADQAKTEAAPATQDPMAKDLAALKDPANILSKRSVYFDYDKYVIKSEFMPLLQAHGKFLASHPQDKVQVQGNADERGSREYNLALGQKRAEAVKKSLLLNGATEAQVEATSNGKEKPVCTESNETCWAKNRRSDIFHSMAKEY